MTTIKNHASQRGKDLFFYSECNIGKRVRLTSSKQINKAYESHLPIQIDAKLFSPCSKSRTYYTNLPVEQPDSSLSLVKPNLDNGYKIPETYVYKRSNSVLKAKSFQPSTLVDDDRMMKVKEVEEKGRKLYELSIFSVIERERMLGFQDGYVFDPLKDLYKHLKDDAFNAEFYPGASWADTLDPKYYHFAKCKFDFGTITTASEDVEPPFYELLIKLPKKVNQKEIFFNCRSYAKHLLGNTSSIACMEFFLSPLKKICTLREYDNADYDFSW
eukprot:310284_1